MCWFQSYGDFAEWVDFACWWSFIGKGLRLQPAQQVVFSDYYPFVSQPEATPGPVPSN